MIPVLETANGEAVGLGVCVPVHTRLSRIQVPVPGIGRRLRGRPEVVVRPLIRERAIRFAVAGKQPAAKDSRLAACASLEGETQKLEYIPRFFRKREGYWTEKSALVLAVTRTTPAAQTIP